MTNGEKFKTAKERAEAIQKYCAQHHDCDGCPFVDLMGDHCSVCQFYWLDLEAPAEEPLPCPFCGSKTIKTTCVSTHCYGYAYCGKCGYRTMECHNRDAAIAAHNRVARAVKEKEAK